MDQRTCPNCQCEFEVRRVNQVYCTKACTDEAGRKRRKQDATRSSCVVHGCERPYVANGYCHKHWRTWKKYGDPTHRQRAAPLPGRAAGGACSFEGCERPISSGGLCAGHYRRKQDGRPMNAPMRKKAPKGSAWLDSKGYRQLTINGKQVPEHRAVMERILGRPLKPFENIHHINGQRADNRPENLELWVTMQPTGQRPVDIVSWIVHHYLELAE